jgi:hypothetical protein
MAEPSDAIPPELREAFHTAVAEYHSWRPGEDEPEVSLARLFVKINDICNRVMDYNDPMSLGRSGGGIGGNDGAAICQNEKLFLQRGDENGDSYGPRSHAAG